MAFMRSDLRLDSDNYFRERLLEKEARREALFRSKDSDEFKRYVHQQAVVNPARIPVGPPLFSAKF